MELCPEPHWEPLEQTFGILQPPAVPLVPIVLNTAAIIIFLLTSCNGMRLSKFHPQNRERKKLQNP